MSDLKPLLIVDKDEEIKQAHDELMEIKKRCDERFKFIKKQVESLESEKKQAIDAFWEKAEKIMLDKKILEKEVPLTLQDGVIYEGQKQNSMHEFLSHLFGRDL